LVKPHNVKRGSRVTGRNRAMPETEKPPAKPVDIYYMQKDHLCGPFINGKRLFNS
jgi:hypothetical protein